MREREEEDKQKLSKFIDENVDLEEKVNRLETKLNQPLTNQESLFNSKTKIQGILTSNIRSRTSTDVPYMAFFRSESANKHSLEECEAQKCKDCEIPVIFRTKTKGTGLLYKPDLKKGDNVILEGEFSQSKDSNRPSFTCYGYEIIK